MKHRGNLQDCVAVKILVWHSFDSSPPSIESKYSTWVEICYMGGDDGTADIILCRKL